MDLQCVRADRQLAFMVRFRVSGCDDGNRAFYMHAFYTHAHIDHPHTRTYRPPPYITHTSQADMHACTNTTHIHTHHTQTCTIYIHTHHRQTCTHALTPHADMQTCTNTTHTYPWAACGFSWRFLSTLLMTGSCRICWISGSFMAFATCTHVGKRNQNACTQHAYGFVFQP
jgi:hypothetical protein